MSQVLKDRVMEVLSRHEPLGTDELMNQVVPHFTNDALETVLVVFSIREIIWPLLASHQLVLTTDQKLFLPDHSKGLCYQPDKNGDCKCCGTSLSYLNGGPQLGCAYCQDHYQKIPS